MPNLLGRKKLILAHFIIYDEGKKQKKKKLKKKEITKNSKDFTVQINISKQNLTI